MDIGEIKGVGPKMLGYLKGMGISTVRDAVYYFPRTYEDRNNIKPIGELVDGEFVGLRVEAVRVLQSGRSYSGKNVTKILFKNETGSIVGVWFNQPYMKNAFKAGENLFICGKVSRKLNEVQLNDIEYEKNDGEAPGGINPVYTANKNISQKLLRKIIKQALEQVDDSEEILSKNTRRIFGLPDIKNALINIHFPRDKSMIDTSLYRLKFDELLVFQLCLYIAKHEYIKARVAPEIKVSPVLSDIKAQLSFELTKAQAKAVREILSDMKKKSPMNRLVQGDVGSGKTIVAVLGLLNTALAGYQAAMMAPTEILAEQHYIFLSGIAQQHNVKVGLIKGSTPKKEKLRVLEALRDGSIHIVIGTHALIQESVEFKNLAMVVTDEQHRFGVRQRATLINKGNNPHVLVMTATPIPRTLALFIYGDMDISIIDELPPGRKKIDTYYMRTDKRDRMYHFIKKELEQGRQAYIICPLVEESEKLDLEAAVDTFNKLRELYFNEFKVGLLHGKMSPSEKDGIMDNFKKGEIHILVSTTVVEVGVNVPNATIMVIENAERFGLSQLHQLRGRVGRGEYKSHCILVSDVRSKEFGERMKIMMETNDGFKIADKDLELRGSGEFFGFRQHGLPELRLSDIVRDIELVKRTRDLTNELMESNSIYDEEYIRFRERINRFLDRNIDEGSFN